MFLVCPLVRTKRAFRYFRPECPGGSKVTMLAQHDVNQSAVAIAR